jgi:CheY-like chemotaxis protein
MDQLEYCGGEVFTTFEPGLGLPVASEPPAVLIVDDHPIQRSLVRVGLDAIGCAMVEAENGLEAVRLYEGRAFAAVIMDIQMPVMDGLAAVAEIRRIEAETGRPPARIIMLTAEVCPQNRARAKAAGANEHLPKPTPYERLLSSVHAACWPSTPILQKVTR